MPSSEPRIPAALKKLVEERARGLCEYCRSPASISSQPFCAEHIVPKARAGDSTAENLALACQGCNNHKYNKVDARDPASGDLVPLYHPRRDRWEEHFCWSLEFTVILGVSPIGRATVAALNLNRPALINLRRVLYLAKEHPPTID
ncbi:MAG: HNH endonuclease signature motif containing protein [Polyangiaceae bacterium]